MVRDTIHKSEGSPTGKRYTIIMVMKVPIESSITDKIDWANRCYLREKDNLLGDPDIVNLLIKLGNTTKDSHHFMTECGIGALCKSCEEKEGGSCCGKGLEDHYSGTLLLINLLLGAKLPEKRHDNRSCFFLQESGCGLLARHVICVNYICKKISDHIDHEKIIALREKEGVELDILFRLNEKILEILD